MGGDYSHHQGAGFGSVTISMSVEEDYYPAVYAYPARFFSFFVVTHPRAHSVTHAWSHSSDQDPPHRFFHLFFFGNAPDTKSHSGLPTPGSFQVTH